MSAAVSTVAVSNKVPVEFKVPHNTPKTTLQECNSRNFIKFHFLQVASVKAASDREVASDREAELADKLSAWTIHFIKWQCKASYLGWAV